MVKYLAIIVLVTACAAPIRDIPEEARDMDGNGAALVRLSFVQWLGQVVLQAVTNITVNVKIERTDDDRN
jgi:hypothetical protein